jgi:hypothetical protein
MKRWILRLTLALAAMAVAASTTTASAQVTTGSIRGLVTDAENRPLEGARITAVHLPSGTQYVGSTRADGRFNIPGMRIGGPYSVAATSIGFARQNRDDIQVSLGVSSDLVFKMDAVATQLNAVTVTSEGGELSTTRTGAATSVRREALERLPTITRRLSDFTRLTPQASGNSFAGADNRLNNITVDGASFNNAFGLGDGQPGGRSGVAPISLDAIEAVQVNIAPYDVRQGGFVGAAVNTVTRAGTNDWSFSAYNFRRNEGNVGRQAGTGSFNPGTFDYNQIGFRLGGPIIKNKLFFFVSYEDEQRDAPLITFRANQGGEAATGNVTRVLASQMDSTANLLRTFGWEPGIYDNVPGATPATRLTARVDYALSDRNKFSLRLTQLDSESDVPLSTSASLGFGRTRNNDFLNFQNSNYTQGEKINGVVAEWNSLLTDRMSNQLIVGFSKSDESRGEIPASNLFPFVDVREGNLPYMAFGSEPFTPNNELRYETTQLQNNFTIFGNSHDLTFGVALEKYESENVFFPGRQSSFVYSSYADWLTDANDFLAQCGTNSANWATCSRASAPAGAAPIRFQVRYNNIPGSEKPVQPLEVLTSSFYVQDEYRVRSNFTVTGGVRVDIATFGETGFENTAANAMTFRDENGNQVQYQTERLPDATPLFSPRLGFNYDVRGNGRTIVRGGTGLFTGRPLYVWISNQIGNNGVITGFIQEDSVTGVPLSGRPFHPNPDHYKPATVTGGPAEQYELALTENSFKFPQLWRTNIAVDHRFENGWLATVEFLWGSEINGVGYINANQPNSDGVFAGPDARARWTTDKCATVVTPGPAPDLFVGSQTNRINCPVSSAFVLQNGNRGYSYNASISLERSFRNGFYAKGATAFGDSYNQIDAGSIAGGSFNGNPVENNPNNPRIARSNNAQLRRSFLVSSYTRDWFGWGNTTISAFLENRTFGTGSYTYSNDLNGDGGNNDLLYVPRNTSEMNFAPLNITSGRFQGTSCSNAVPCAVSSATQAAAWDAYINQDPYLRTRRGQYAERNGLIFPQLTRMDVSIVQDISRTFASKPNSLQVRLDILNFTNMINSDWGLAQVPVSTTPLASATPLTTGPTANFARHTMRVVNGELINRTFQKTAFESDVWRLQLGLRYTFN